MLDVTKFIIKFFLPIIACLPGNAHEEYWQTFGPATIASWQEFYPGFNSPPPTIPEGDVKVYITSSNPTYIQAVKKIFTKLTKNNSSNIIYIEHDITSQIAPQPLGIEYAKLGAQNMLQEITKKVNNDAPNAYFIVAIQQFCTPPSVYIPRSHHLVMIRNHLGENLQYVSNAVMIAEEVYDEALDNHGLSLDGSGANYQIGQVLAQWYGTDPVAWHSMVTQNKNSTADLLVLSVVQ